MIGLITTSGFVGESKSQAPDPDISIVWDCTKFEPSHCWSQQSRLQRPLCSLSLQASVFSPLNSHSSTQVLVLRACPRGVHAPRHLWDGMAPPGELTCGLEREWARLFSSKNAESIRRFQDRHQCCGLHSLLDRTWPFPDGSHTTHSCVQAFDRQRNCFDDWRRDELLTGDLMLFIAVVVFLLKVRVPNVLVPFTHRLSNR